MEAVVKKCGWRKGIVLFAMLVVLAGCECEKEHWAPAEPNAYAFPRDEVIALARALDAAAEAGDYAAFAKHLEYPFVLYDKGEAVDVLSDEGAFVKLSPVLIDAGVKRAIHRAARGEPVFANYQGNMFGDGEVWIRRDDDGVLKVFAINSASMPRKPVSPAVLKE